jgi:hypothetical protein
MLRWKLTNALHPTHRYFAFVTLLFIAYSSYAVIDQGYLHNYRINTVLFIITLPNCILLAKWNRSAAAERSSNALPVNRFDKAAKFWYLSNLYMTLVIALTVIPALMFLALQLFAFSTNAFFTKDGLHRYIQTGSSFLTVVYLTGFFLQSSVSEKSLILLSFYGSWLCLQLVTYYGKTA